MDKQAIADDLEHQQTMLKLRKQRLQYLEQQEAKFGFDVDAHVSAEIHELRERIHEYNAEIEKFQIMLAEETVSITEAEYRELLAKSWCKGSISVIEETQLEFARLRLRILSDRAKQLEKQIRTALAEYNFSKIPRVFLLEDRSLMSIREERDPGEVRKDIFVHLSRSILLDLERTLALFLEQNKRDYTLADLDELLDHLTHHQNLHPTQPEQKLFQEFIDILREKLNRTS